MTRIASRLGALALLLALASGALTGCDAVEGIFGGNEITGVVETIDATSLTVDANRYSVDANTTIEDFASLSAIAVGTEVEVSYEDRAGERAATEISDPNAGG